MKAKFVTLVFISILSTSAFPQSFKIGFKGGANINKLTGQSFNEQFSFGYHIGGFAEIGLGKKWAVQPEVLFSQTNVDTSGSFSSVYQFNKVSKVKLQYLSIPLLLDYKANRLITLQAGPQFGILINKSNTLVQNGKDAFKSGDFSMLGGVQLNILNFKFYGRYVVGLNNLNDIDNKEKWKSQGFQLGIGITL